MDDAEQCLPAPGVPERILLNGTYTESTVSFSEGDFKKGEISWDESPSQAIQWRINAPDPEIKGRTFDWQAKYDWTCLKKKEYPVIGERWGYSLLQEGTPPDTVAQMVALRLLALASSGCHVLSRLRKATKSTAGVAAKQGSQEEEAAGAG